jgi:ATP-dependent Clp protease adaptor protein ClpS
MSGSNQTDGTAAGTAVDEPAAPQAAPKSARPRPKPVEKPKHQPPYAVVILNDDDHTYPYVIDTLCRFCGHTAEKAFKLAQEIDKTGRAAVWTGALEVAELKRDQIRGMGPDLYAMKPVTYPLGVVLEPMPQ